MNEKKPLRCIEYELIIRSHYSDEPKILKSTNPLLYYRMNYKLLYINLDDGRDIHKIKEYELENLLEKLKSELARLEIIE